MKSINRTVPATQNENGLVDNGVSEIVAGFGYFVDMPHAAPVSTEDMLLFEFEPVAIEIGICGQG
jgi:hypothetical protein